MRFLILTQYFLPEIGAPQTRLAGFSKELLRLGHEVEVVTAMPHHLTGKVQAAYRGRIYKRDSWSGITVHRTWVYAASGTGLRRMLNYLSFTASSLAGLLMSKRADYVFVESPPLFLCVPAWLASVWHRGRTIFNVADLWPDSVRELGVLKDGLALRIATRMECWAYRKADFVNSVTHGITKILKDDKHVPVHKLLYLPNGIDVTQFFPQEPDAGVLQRFNLAGRKVFVYAGTHGVAQGLETLIEAARLLQDSQATFLFIGDGSRKAALQTLANRYGLRNVVFLEPQPLSEMPKYFSIAYASVVPLVKAELFKAARPSKIFPSLASGVPVLYSGEGESAAFVTGKGVGLAVPPESPRQLQDAILYIMGHPGVRDEMASRGRELTVSEFSWQTIVGNWLCALIAKDRVNSIGARTY